MANSKAVEEACNAVFNRLMALSEEEFRAELEKASTSDWMPILEEMFKGRYCMQDEIKTCLTDGSPVTEDHREIDSTTGMQKGYVVLCPEERAKGFVRPLRRSYVHKRVRPKYPTRELTAEEHERYDKYGYVLYEEYPKGDPSGICGMFWTEATLSSGCNNVTTMGYALAETYARDPKFYGSTFCCGCGKHFPVREFVWEGTNEVVGS